MKRVYLRAQVWKKCPIVIQQSQEGVIFQTSTFGIYIIRKPIELIIVGKKKFANKRDITRNKNSYEEL